MKILQICKKNPFPPRDGETKAIDILARGLLDRGVELSVLSFNTSKHYVEKKDFAQAPYSIETVDLDNQLNYPSILLDYIRGYSPNFRRFYNTKMEKRIADTVSRESFDLIQLEGSYLLAYVDIIRRHTKIPIVVRSHNVEYQIWERLAEGEKWPKKWIIQAMAERMKSFELKRLGHVDAVVPISLMDQASFQQSGLRQPMLTIPMGVKLNGSKPSRNMDQIAPKSLAFIGSMDWEPNKEGINWFLNKVWGQLKQDQPDGQFYLAGRNMPPCYESLNVKGLNVVGEVEDPSKYLENKAAVIIPLLSGSGMRIKAIEAMELCVPLISTSIGVEGIPVENRKHILIADTPQEMRKAVTWVWRHPKEAEAMAQRAQKLVYKQFNIEVLTDRILEFYQEILAE